MARRSVLSSFSIAQLQAELSERVTSRAKELAEERSTLTARLAEVNAELAQIQGASADARTPAPAASSVPAAATRGRPAKKAAAPAKGGKGAKKARVSATTPDSGPTLSDLVRSELEQASEPLPLATIIERVGAKYTGKAKNIAPMISAAIKGISGVKKVSRGVYTMPAFKARLEPTAAPVVASTLVLSGSEEA